ncbi:MAG TPA: hypothetical protein VML95_01220 [Longimicrobiales bacterium]|nr:hypothetical protein [Longimicrobiales bacterium]
MPVIRIPDIAVELLLEVGWSAAGVLLGALLLGVRERVVLSTIGVAALHGVITWILVFVLEGPYGVSPWIPIAVSLLVMVVLVEIFFETGWPRSMGIALIGMAVADWQLLLALWRAVPG